MGVNVVNAQPAKTQRVDPQRSARGVTPHSTGFSGTSPIDKLQRAVGNRSITSLLRSQIIQPKLSVSHPEDESEREADRVAEQVMRMTEPPGQQDEEKEGLIQRKFGLPVQRKCTGYSSGGEACSTCAEEEKLQRAIAPGPVESIVQAKHDRSQGEIAPTVPADFGAALGGGRPLPAVIRSFFEPRFGADFSGVRVHTHNEAAQVARSLNAKAFTLGRDLVFGAGQYSPETTSGKQLLAHELTHVLQQEGGRRARNEQALSLASLAQNSSVQTSGEGVIRRAPISGQERAADEGSDVTAESEVEDEEMEPEAESSDECETISEESEEETATGSDLGEVSATFAAGKENKSKPKRPGWWATLMEKRRNRKECKRQGKGKKRKKGKSPKDPQTPVRCITKYELDQTEIASGRQPLVRNQPTNRNFVLDDPNCFYVVRWDMKDIPDRIIITDNNTNALIVDTAMVAGTGSSQFIPGPANINIQVIPNDGTDNPDNEPTVYEYKITATCGRVKKIRTCFWLGVVPMGRRVESEKFDPTKNYRREKSKWMTRNAARRLLGKN